MQSLAARQHENLETLGRKKLLSFWTILDTCRIRCQAQSNHIEQLRIFLTRTSFYREWILI